MAHNEAQDNWDFDAAEARTTAERFTEAWYKDVTGPQALMRHEDYIEYGWRDVFCMCLSPAGTERDETKCKRCGKQRRWLYIRACKVCGKPYYYGFKHPHKGNRHCWDCLVKEYGQADNDVPPPDWAHPKQVATIDEILDFDFGDEF